METNFSRLSGITDPDVLAQMSAIRHRMVAAHRARDRAAWDALAAEHRALMAVHAPETYARAQALAEACGQSLDD